MSSSARRSRMEALKQGNVSSDEEDDDFYEEEEADDGLDDFVIQDEDVGYKASAHQKQQSQSRKPSNRQNKNRRKPTMAKKQSQSYSISRRKRQNNASKNSSATAKPSAPSQSKNQSTMKSFFKPSTAKPRNVVQKKSKKKKAPKQNDDAFMNDILGNMDSDDDDDDDIDDEVQEDETMNIVPEKEEDDEYQTQPQTQADLTATQLTEPQAHHTQTQQDILEPPKKRFKLSATAGNKPEQSDKMEMDDDNAMDPMTTTTKGDVEQEATFESKEKEIPPEHNMFNTASNTKNDKAEVLEEGNTDNYPECGAGFVDIFWFDAYEDAVRKPGQIYLFGKTLNKSNGEWQSVCLFIKNIERCMYILPRLKNKADDVENGERVEFIDVYNEINEKRQRFGISKFAAGPMERKYCFRERAEGIPASATYLKLCYSFEYPPFEGRGKTFQRVFGSRCTALELFLLDKQLMGPCWLRVPYGKPARIVSWCKKEICVDDMDNVSVLSSNYPSPPFKVMSLSFQTVLNNKKEHEIACVSAVVHNAVYVDHSNKNKKEQAHNMEYFSYIRKIGRNPFPYDLEKELKKKNFNVTSNTFREFASERELLTFFTARIMKLDPDVIVGHKLYDFLLDVMLHRMDTLNINMWSKIGRLRRGKIPFVRGRLMRKYLGAGRLFCDTFLSAQEFIHEKTYTLSHLVKAQLGVDNHENLNPKQIKKKWFDGKELAAIITHCCNDSNLVFNLQQKLEILPLTKELTNLCGNLWARSLTSQRAERNEWLLLHEFHRNGYIVPERYTKAEKISKGILRDANKGGKKRGKAQYSGGLVLEPTRGLYDKYVLCLDFNSLYPSIIQEYNLCFTSTPHWKYITNHNAVKKEEDAKESDITSMQQGIAAESGILPKVIGVLLTRRGTVKKLLKSCRNEADRRRFDVQQKALKLVANSMYGCLGFEYSRFYCKPIAALITALGRESLMKAAEIASSIGNLKVIYGDTDSIFIYTDCDNLIRARNYAKEIKKKVNKTYKKMYLELDYVFSKMLLLRKKKYAAIKVVSFDTDSATGGAINIVTTKEIKGLDLVRRDWSIISKDVGREVLDCILAPNQQIDDVVIGVAELLTKYRKLMDENAIELRRFVITKKLTKAPKDYPDPRKQPHVMVAIEMQKLGMNIGTGSFIEYIICKQNRDGSQVNKAIAQRAYHIKEIENEQNKLEVDRNWYLEQQILPPVGRYCEPISGTDIGHLAHALGLDSNKFAHLKKTGENDGDDDDDQDDIDEKILRITNPLQKYGEICRPLKIKCRYCGNSYDFGGVYNFKTIDAKCGLICATTNCRGIVSQDQNDKNYEIDIAQIKNSLSLQIWQFIYQYYSREWQCINLECGHKTRQIALNGAKCPKIGCSAKMRQSFSAQKLFDQLRYFAFLFDKNENEKLLKQEMKNNPAIAQKHRKITAHQERICNDLHRWIKNTILQRSKYYFIDSKVIFKYCM